MRAIDLQAQLERDLGLGSIERSEFFHRIEKNFGIRLPESLLADIKCISDLV